MAGQRNISAIGISWLHCHYVKQVKLLSDVGLTLSRLMKSDPYLTKAVLVLHTDDIPMKLIAVMESP